MKVNLDEETLNTYVYELEEGLFNMMKELPK